LKTHEQRKTTAVEQPSEQFLNNGFLQKAKRELEKNGFISDEHDFAPYRDALSQHRKQIERELRKIGFGGHLAPGFVANHPDAGYAYYLYDTTRFHDQQEAESAVSRWLNRKYQGEAHV
jgi:hypothetical protein